MRNRGYDTALYHTLDTGLHKPVTELQIASFHPHIIDLARTNAEGLAALLRSGLSANPCNRHGESLLHWVCRNKNLEALEVLIECDADLLVSDDYGRTPLHDACWNDKPNFAMIDCLLTNHDDGPRYLFHTLDRHGGSPLGYVDRMAWHEWLCYLEARKDTYWPVCNRRSIPETELFKTLHAKPGSLEVTKPVAVLPPKIAADVASGRLAPSEATLFLELEDDASSDGDDSSEDSSWSDSDCSSSSDEEDDVASMSVCEEVEGYEIEDESDENEEESIELYTSNSSMDIDTSPPSRVSTETSSDENEKGPRMNIGSSWGVLDDYKGPSHVSSWGLLNYPPSHGRTARSGRVLETSCADVSLVQTPRAERVKETSWADVSDDNCFFISG
jgi:Ankyrin repeats (3 copies)